jgi:serine/threonine-protein kinase
LTDPETATKADASGANEAATRMAGASGANEAATRMAGSSSSSSGWLTASDAISHGRFAPGALLSGRYRIIGLLGRGGMGEVYRADDLRLGQQVALKFLPDEVAHDPVRLAQFHNEVRTARQVSHPNVCRVYDIGEIEGRLFLSMEFVDGEDLATSIRRIGRFPEDKALDVARQLCAALAAAHERRVIHRDLKPANVMLDSAGKIRIMDFGLATIGAVADAGAGTPAYMAPEQLLGAEVTARSDIYALGLVLYELFTGRRAFAASTLNDLIAQQQSGQPTPPSSTVSSLDPAIDRAILRCLHPTPAARPSSALAVAAALPGGDPLAAAIAAGETPSPEMVAATGEGAGLGIRPAVALFAAVLALLAAGYVLGLRTDAVAQLQPELNADVLAQKARESLRAAGLTDRPGDEAYGFFWEENRRNAVTASTDRDWHSLLGEQPSPLQFWYRRSAGTLDGYTFHHDLLTPGIVTLDDPGPTVPGMAQVVLDSRGLLLGFETIPPQVQAPPDNGSAVDWTPLFALAGVDGAGLRETTPHWHWLASADTRTAWTGTWPGGEPLRVEAAALFGRPVAFQMIGPWTTPPRAEVAAESGETAIVIIYVTLLLAVVIGAAVLAARHVRAGRGDRTGAIRLAAAVTAVLWAIWLCQVHVSPSIGLIGAFLVAIVTTTFYGLLFWTIYLALEPFVRRHWPQTLVSWTTVLAGRVRDPIVARDLLIGVALGAVIALLIRSVMRVEGGANWTQTDVLLGSRAVVGHIAMQAIYALRSALFVFFLLFLFRALLRNQWAAALALVGVFAVVDALDSTKPLLEGATTALYFGLLAGAVLRWGLITLTTAMLVANLVLAVPATVTLSAWYVEATALSYAVPLGLAGFALMALIRRPAAAPRASL